jgi:hypothetical protein
MEGTSYAFALHMFHLSCIVLLSFVAQLEFGVFSCYCWKWFVSRSFSQKILSHHWCMGFISLYLASAFLRLHCASHKVMESCRGLPMIPTALVMTNFDRALCYVWSIVDDHLPYQPLSFHLMYIQTEVYLSHAQRLALLFWVYHSIGLYPVDWLLTLVAISSVVVHAIRVPAETNGSPVALFWV